MSTSPSSKMQKPTTPSPYSGYCLWVLSAQRRCGETSGVRLSPSAALTCACGPSAGKTGAHGEPLTVGGPSATTSATAGFHRLGVCCSREVHLIELLRDDFIIVYFQVGAKTSIPQRSLARRRCLLYGPSVMNKAPIARRPIAQHGLANDVLYRQAAPGVRIARVIAVVSQNKDVTWLDDRGWMRVVRPLKDIRLIEHMPINQHLAAHNLQIITR